MSNQTNQAPQSINPTDWKQFYIDLQNKGKVPNAATMDISANTAIFRDNYLNLSEVKENIRKSGKTPIMTTLYTDVLEIPEHTNWLLQSQALIVYARRVEVKGKSSILLDMSQSKTAQVIFFAREMTGRLEVMVSESSTQQPTPFHFDQSNVTPGISVAYKDNQAISRALDFSHGFGFQKPKDQDAYLRNAFIYASLLYDQNEALALSILLWVKAWSAQSTALADLFYRSTSLATLLNAQINAASNGAKFVPYLTSDVYTDLAGAFANYVGKYEQDYQTLNTQKVLTEENIALAKTMTKNAASEVDYVQALLKQAQTNYQNAVAAATKAEKNFKAQKLAVKLVAIDFQKVGLPEYISHEIVKAVFSLAGAIMSFTAAIGAMAIGDGSAAPGAAKKAIDGAKAVGDAAAEGKELAKSMQNLKDFLEGLDKIFELALAVHEVSENIKDANEQMEAIQAMEDTNNGLDISAANMWAIYKLQVGNVLAVPIKKEIEFASDYKEAIDILVVYGQAFSASRLAVIKASQEVSAIKFQLHFAKQKEANLEALVNELEAGKAPVLSMMQEFYQRYIDGKSNLFTALKNYQASYFYWALKESNVQARIVDPVSDLSAGIQSITRIAMDKASALKEFDPPPQQMENMHFTMSDPQVIEELRRTGEATWTLPLDDPEFLGLNRVRLDTIRVWLEGLVPGENGSVFMTISTTGNYLDHYKNEDYQFNTKLLNRTFKYRIADTGGNPDWHFDNGKLGFVQIDGAVNQEVAYAYFKPTPFSEWKISLRTNSPGMDYSKLSKITMYFAGSAIGTTAALRNFLLLRMTAPLVLR